MSKDRSLCWTSLPILDELQSPPEVLHRSLGLQSPPPVRAVMQHLATITTTPLDQWDQKLKMDHGAASGSANPTKVLLEVFAFLDQHWSDLNSAQQSALQRMSLVPIGGSLIKPSRLYFRLDAGSLSPFMFEVPRMFGQYDALLSKLGTQAIPQRRDYARLLHELYLELMPDRTLNVNELQAVIKVIQLLADKVGADEEDEEELVNAKSPKAKGAAASAGSDASSMLVYVPDELTRLVPAFSCVFSDSAWLSQRISHSKLHFANAGLSDTLSRKVGVRALTDAIEERLEKLINVEDAVADGSHAAGSAVLSNQACEALQGLFHSVEFARGILRLYEDQISRTQQYAQWSLIPAVESLHALLCSFNLQFVMAIRTRLILMPERIDVTLEDNAAANGSSSGSLALMYVDFSTKQIYVNVNREEVGSVRATLILSNAIARVLATFLKGLDGLRNLTPLNSMLDMAVSSAQEGGAGELPAAMLQPLLNRLEILQIDHVSLRRGMVGECLHPFDAALVQLTPLRLFHVGELVAFKDQQGKYRYGQVVRDETHGHAAAAASPSSAAATAGGASSSSSSSAVPPSSSSLDNSSSAFSTLLVRIHPHKNALLSSADLFSFSTNLSSSGGGGGQESGASAGGDESAEKLLRANVTMMQQMQAHAQRQEKAKQSSGAAAGVMQPHKAEPAAVPALIASASSSSASSSAASAAASPLDRSRTQLLSAVSSLLQQAQLPLSLERESLVRENLLLRQQCELAERKASEAYARESALNSKIERLQTAFTVS